MTPELVTAASGAPSLRFGEEHLEDPIDPMAAAEQFAAALPEDAVDVVLFGTGLGYRVRWLIAKGHAPLVLEPCPDVRRLAEAREPGIFEGAMVFDAVRPLVSTLLTRSKAGEKIVLLAPPPYVRAFPESYHALREAIREADGMRSVRKNTALARYRPQIEGTLRSLPRLVEAPLAGRLGRPLEGKAAFVVAAGPSLDRNAHLLTEARGRGALLVVTTASPVVAGLGLRYDALVTIETLDQSAMLAEPLRSADALVADMVAHPRTLDLPARRRALFLADHRAFSDLGAMLGEPGVSYGASVPTAAVALAQRWGADPIVLLGQDLAFTGGRSYATGTGRENFRVTFRRGVVTLDYDEAFAAAFVERGIQPPGKSKPGVLAPAWGGEGEVVTTHDLLLSARWFEAFAAAVAGGTRLVNATEGGVRLEGWEETPLARVLEGLPEAHVDLPGAIDAAPRVAAADVAALRATLAKGTRAVGRAARECLAARSPGRRRKAEASLRALSKEHRLVDTWASTELTKLLDDPGLATDAEARSRRVLEAIVDAARDVARLLEGA